MADIIRFPSDMDLVAKRLTLATGVTATANLPTTFTENLLISGTSYRPSMVQRRTTYIIEARAATVPRALQVASDCEAVLEAWCRTEDTGPYDFELGSLITNYPDPDDGKPRAVLTCTMTWDRL